MSKIKWFIDKTFNNLKSKFEEEEYNNKIKEHLTKILIDVCNNSYSKDEYGKIDIGKIKHPESRYIIHQNVFNIKNSMTDSEQDDLNKNANQISKYFGKRKFNGIILIDNFGERYVFQKVKLTFDNGGSCYKYRAYSRNTRMPDGYIEDYSSNEIFNDIEFQLIPSKNEYEYPLTNKIIDFVKSQNFPIGNLDILSKIMASIETYKEIYDKKKYDELVNENNKLISKLEKYDELLIKYNEQLELNKLLHSTLNDQENEIDNIYEYIVKLIEKCVED